MYLSSLDIAVLHALSDGKEHTIDEIAASIGSDQAGVARASLSLQKEGYASQRTDTRIVAEITKEGKKALAEGLLETKLLRELGNESKKIDGIKVREKDVALGWAKKKGYVEIRDGYVYVSKKGRESLKKEEPELVFLKEISRGKVPKKEHLFLLKSRKLATYSIKTVHYLSITKKGIKFAKKAKAEKEISSLTPELLKDKKWEKVLFRRYDVSAPVPEVYYGKRHFVSQAIEYVRRIYLEMGFKEMEGPLINTSFWNFDALFTPQDHPVREMQDTFYIDSFKGTLPNERIVARVKKAHESGVCGSLGWRYKWRKEEAEKIVLRTHTTVLSARTLARLKKDSIPAKYFAIGKCFRNETLDWSHLFEFNQFEGIVVDRDANFRHLLGYLREFFRKLGFSKARFRPAYFPYTEMSVEIEVFHPIHKEWIELGGAGIFRPEVVEPLLGEWVPVLAWGPGFDRILMDYYGIADIRDLYKNDVKQLRETRQWMW